MTDRPSTERIEQVIRFVYRMREPDIVRPDEENSLRHLLSLVRDEGRQQAADAAIERFDPDGSYDGWDVRAQIAARVAGLNASEHPPMWSADAVGQPVPTCEERGHVHRHPTGSPFYHDECDITDRDASESPPTLRVNSMDHQLRREGRPPGGWYASESPPTEERRAHPASRRITGSQGRESRRDASESPGAHSEGWPNMSQSEPRRCAHGITRDCEQCWWIRSHEHQFDLFAPMDAICTASECTTTRGIAIEREAGRAVQDDGLDVERLALWIHYTRHGNRDPDYIMGEARKRAARIIEGLRAAPPLHDPEP